MPTNLFSTMSDRPIPEVVTFEDDAGAYDQTDAEGFIKLNALRLRLGAKKGRSLKK